MRRKKTKKSPVHHHYRTILWKTLTTGAGILLLVLLSAFTVMYELDVFPQNISQEIKWGRGLLEALIGTKVIFIAFGSMKVAYHRKRHCKHCKENLVKKIREDGEIVWECLSEFCKSIK